MQSSIALSHSNVTRWVVSPIYSSKSGSLPVQEFGRSSRIGKLTINNSVLINDVDTIFLPKGGDIAVMDENKHIVANAALIIALFLCAVGLISSVLFQSSGLAVLFPLGLAIWLVTGHILSRTASHG